MLRRRAFLLISALLLSAPACSSNPGGSATSAASGPGGVGGHSAGGSHAGGSGAGGQGGADTALRVLFVGNSYIFVNDLPGLVAGIDAGGPTIEVDSVTVGGATLAELVADGDAEQKLKDISFTHVVIQGQSVEPLYQPQVFLMAANQMASVGHEHGAAPVFFETWARAAGHAVYQEVWSGGTPATMQAGLRQGYQQAADEGGGVMAPAGDAFETTLGQQPAMVLHQSDGSHPSMAGSYLTAAVMYLVLTGRSDFVMPAAAPIDEGQAATLRAIAVGQVSGE